MKIASSQLSMAAEHVAVSFTSIRESATFWVGQRPGESTSPAHPPMDHLDLSEQCAERCAESGELKDWQSADPKYTFVKLLLERLLGSSFEWLDPSDFTELTTEAKEAQAAAQELSAAEQQAAAEPEEGWGMTVDREVYREEAEALRFRAEGQVLTEDGKSLTFSVDMGLSRQFIYSQQTQMRFGDDARVKDPLVLNYAGPAAELTDRTFEFDLDSDGTPDRISFVAPGSGFLAIDRNQNGKVDDGGELFGPATGNGWAELAALDDDANGWIDENDAAFDQLRLWSRDQAGNDELTGLLARNIGAISLSAVAAPFEYTTAADETLGQSRSAGIFLREDGSGAGTVQQIDLVA